MKSLRLFLTFSLLRLTSLTTAQRACGSNPSKAEISEAERQFRAAALSPDRVDAKKAVKVNVYFHVIRNAKTLEGGNVPNSQIHDQIAQLNSDYKPTGISFKLAQINRVTNDSWFRNVANGFPLQTEMKTALHQGGAADLNVYTVSFNNTHSRGLLGYSTFPWNYQANPTDDGVVLRYTTLPGGTYDGFNLGKQLTHETGHWVGLYHTFQGGCEGDGDFVSDTPAQDLPASGCPETQDSCPDVPGLDPVHNYMDWSDDSCINQFTAGQITRLRAQIATYRGL